MSETYMTGQFSLQAEQEQDFLHASTLFALDIAQALKTMDFEKYLQLSSTPFADSPAPYITENFEIAKLYMAVHAADCLRAVNENGLPSSITENLKKKAFSQIAAAHSIQDLGDSITELLHELGDTFRRHSVCSYSYLVQRAIEYIYSRRFQPLTCSMVADYLRAERTNLSRRFHQETGVTMNDFIHSTKMDLAETLIHGRNYSLREICDLLGYSNYSYFSKLYKKYKHCPPSKG